jgi:ATP synthase alpha/beta family, beta-barrel domain/ATP synthase A chain
MLPIELISRLARPLSLTVRLFANMFAGEQVYVTFIALTKVVIPVIFIACISLLASCKRISSCCSRWSTSAEQSRKSDVIQVTGPAIEVQFSEGHIPTIFNAVRITSEGFDMPVSIDITAEIAQHVGEGIVRAIAMEPTDELVRGMKAYDLGAPITIPVGKQTLGRVLNVWDSQSIIRAPLPLSRGLRFTDRLRCSMSNPRISRCLRPALK